MSEGSAPKQPDVKWRWVFITGIPVGFLAAFDPDGAWVWWAISHLVVWVWGLKYVAPVVSTLAVLALLAGVGIVGGRMWRRRDW